MGQRARGPIEAKRASPSTLRAPVLTFRAMVIGARERGRHGGHPAAQTKAELPAVLHVQAFDDAPTRWIAAAIGRGRATFQCETIAARAGRQVATPTIAGFSVGAR